MVSLRLWRIQRSVAFQLPCWQLFLHWQLLAQESSLHCSWGCRREMFRSCWWSSRCIHFFRKKAHVLPWCRSVWKGTSKRASAPLFSITSIRSIRYREISTSCVLINLDETVDKTFWNGWRPVNSKDWKIWDLRRRWCHNLLPRLKSGSNLLKSSEGRRPAHGWEWPKGERTTYQDVFISIEYLLGLLHRRTFHPQHCTKQDLVTPPELTRNDSREHSIHWRKIVERGG